MLKLIFMKLLQVNQKQKKLLTNKTKIKTTAEQNYLSKYILLNTCN